jgi:hypothetical protein
MQNRISDSVLPAGDEADLAIRPGTAARRSPRTLVTPATE